MAPDTSPSAARTQDRTLREGAIGLATAAGTWILHWLDGYFRRHSLVGDRTFFDTAQFPWIPTFEAHWPVIRRELDGLLCHREMLPSFQQIATPERHLSSDDGWKTYFFFGYGLEIRHTPERCPETARLIRQIPGMTTALFSFLAPGKRLPPHRGPYGGVLRYHLALKIPEPAGLCGLRVGTDVRHGRRGAAWYSTTPTSTRRGTTRKRCARCSSWTSSGRFTVSQGTSTTSSSRSSVCPRTYATLRRGTGSGRSASRRLARARPESESRRAGCFNRRHGAASLGYVAPCSPRVLVPDPPRELLAAAIELWT